jgi:hypothetical protein
MPHRVILLSYAALLVTVVAMRGEAQDLSDRVPLLDQLEIVHLDRDLVALGAAGGDARVRLELGERVVWTGTRGIAGSAVTDRRLLLVAAGNGRWQEVRFLRDETPATGAWVGERVVLAYTSRRVLGFSALGGNVSEYRLGPNERIEVVDVAEGVGVVLTDRNALGFSSRLGSFAETTLMLREQVEAVEASAELVTVRTDRRLLVFRGTGGVWGDRRRELGGS